MIRRSGFPFTEMNSATWLSLLRILSMSTWFLSPALCSYCFKRFVLLLYCLSFKKSFYTTRSDCYCGFLNRVVIDYDTFLVWLLPQMKPKLALSQIYRGVYHHRHEAKEQKDIGSHQPLPYIMLCIQDRFS